MRLLLVGYGKMGKLVDEMAREQTLDVVGRLDVGDAEWPEADVAVDFTTAEALAVNFPRYVERRLPVVIGTTGWAAHAAAYRVDAERAGLGVVASANFSIGVNIFELLVIEAAKLLQGQSAYGAWIYEQHHDAKRDAPSGTALLLREAMIAAGFTRGIDMASTRAGFIPGTHTVGFDGPSDTIELRHAARDRRGFAAGALLAARWLSGRSGWYSMRDVIAGLR